MNSFSSCKCTEEILSCTYLLQAYHVIEPSGRAGSGIMLLLLLLLLLMMSCSPSSQINVGKICATLSQYLSQLPPSPQDNVQPKHQVILMKFKEKEHDALVSKCLCSF